MEARQGRDSRSEARCHARQRDPAMPSRPGDAQILKRWPRALFIRAHATSFTDPLPTTITPEHIEHSEHMEKRENIEHHKTISSQ